MFIANAMKPEHTCQPKGKLTVKTKRDLCWFWLLSCLFVSAPVAANTGIGASLPEQIASIVGQKQHPSLTWADFSRFSDDVARLYQLNEQKLLWLGTGRSEKKIDDAFRLLSSAPEHGLKPEHYDIPSLQDQFKKVLSMPLATDNEFLLSDMALSISLLRFMHDLRDGRVSPADMRYQFSRPKPPFDFAAVLKQHWDADNIGQLATTVEPKLKLYQRLKSALTNYRYLEAQRLAHAFAFDKPLRPGGHHPQVSELRQLLQNLGDLSANPALSGDKHTDLYNSELVEAMKKFQQRHGLKSDGVIGKSSANLLNLPLAQKITQLELSLERLRWLPDDLSGPLIIVNIPAFQLSAFNSIDDEPLNMRVIVGKADKNPTPLLFEEMKYLEFMPYWNIPHSIVQKEIIPKLLQDGNYLARQNIELVKTYSSEEGDFVYSPISDLRQGRARIRQRPGSKNALGKVKFIFPNKADVYLHDTPTASLFGRTRRDFSHGCVRVEEPVKLAEFVLSNQVGWDKESIQKAMSAGSKNRRVPLEKSVPVLFFYMTSFVDQHDNLIFYDDIYGQDLALQKMLNKPPVSMANTSLVSKETPSGG